jgi:(p)ppGpp synthase/HD superfamily hydrolase
MSYVESFKNFCRTGHNTRAIGYTNGYQVRWGGEPYFDTHCVAVAKIAVSYEFPRIFNQIKFNFPVDIEKIKRILTCIGYAHDLVEDTDVTIEEIRKELLLLDAPLDEIEFILNAVALLTKPKGDFDLFVYLNGIKTDIFALIGKLADNSHNTSDLKDKKKIEKYRLIRYYLEH